MDIFGPDLLCRLRHGSSDDRTFDFSGDSPPEARWLVERNDIFAAFVWFLDTESPVSLISVQQISENP